MKIISWNVNGIRAVERKGELEKFISKYDPDIVLLQETKAKEEQLGALGKKYEHYDQFYHSAEKPGYSGTGIWVRKEIPENMTFAHGMPDFDDSEGRVAKVFFGNYVVLGVYFPNGGKSEEAWAGKMVFYQKFLDYVNSLRKEGLRVIWTGDVNCAHEEIDIARPKENENSIGFLPEERAWVSKVIENNWIDIFRKRNPDTVIYSWWHLISKARERNVGWRIDYFFVDKTLSDAVKNVAYLNDQMGSDHCPVLLEIDVDL